MTTAVSHAHEPGDPATKDLEQFVLFLRQGAPGPHAYVVLLGLQTFDGPDLLKTLRKGLRYQAFERFWRNTALDFDSVVLLVDIPRRTLTRRKREGRFQPEESDRLLRAARLFGAALELFEGDRDAAAEWLTSGQAALGGAMPLDLASSDLGAREVERLIHRLEHGVFS
jgi:putative toxin-antitoxin system antitoxin component (TIGR02293 family)